MDRMRQLISERVEPARKRVRALIKEHGGRAISEINLAQLYGGVRGVICLINETSALDPMQGIRYRGRTIPELLRRLPQAPGGHQPLAEGLLFLLMTGEEPSDEDAAAVGADLRARAHGLDAVAAAALAALPPETEPMAQLAIGVLAMQRHSEAHRAYQAGAHHRDLWESTYDDALNLLAQLPALAAAIHRRARGLAEVNEPPDGLDWAGRLAWKLAGDAPLFAEAIRLFTFLHGDHEGGNIGAHATHLVGSGLADPYYALSAGVAGLAGPLHGRATQDFMRWVTPLVASGGAPSREDVERHCVATLEQGQVIPGFGHAVLRRVDPRYVALYRFCREHFPESDLVQTVGLLYEVVPEVLKRHGQDRNVWPTVDAYAGVLLRQFAVVDEPFYGVLVAVSRAIGVLSALVWDRILALPPERPKSVTTDWLVRHLERSS
ncbi:MAG: type I citrate synthase [Deltaproteobacteria bacterium HGW-Deltaproteobacteria-14]|jgi:citrate synthase|nr:MAG: type I citrate synthase [Deltaproteobacteria bacterium HGW-Deltaproteobacteria-14]